MSKGIIETVAGVALIAGTIGAEILTGGAIPPQLASFLIKAGTGLVIAGVGTMLAGKGALSGFATSSRNPIAPWNVVYGRARVGGTVVYIGEFGDSNKFLDMVIVLAAHECEGVDELLFDNQRVQIGSNNTSFSPLQQTINIHLPSDITRVGNVVTVKLNANIPLLQDGDQVIIQGVHPVSLGLNGKFPVTIIEQIPGSPGSITFTYLSGGPSTASVPVTESGSVKTAWADYGKKVYMQVMTGTQTLGSTFSGMILGTPMDGDIGNIVINENNPWTLNCSLVGKTAVFLRLHYNDAIFANGLPQISFHIRGKNDILDPRTSPPTRGYTENSALCIADYLSNQTWGFKAEYGTEIPSAQLIAAANICDEAVELAEPPSSPLTTEPRYTCNGQFQLTMKRGEVLKNLLTSCAGRITYTGGQFAIWPGAWGGVSASVTGTSVYSMAAGAIRWRPTVSISNLYNGVKGTYISPVNGWQSADFPAYAQDATHGYDDGDPAFEFDANLTADGGDRRWLDIQLPFTNSCPTAQRLAKIELMRRRQQGTGTFLLNMAGYQFAPMDIVAMDLPFFGWTAKNLEIQAARLKLDRVNDGESEVTLLGTEIDVQEADPSVYEWSIGEELSPAGYQQAITPSTLTPSAPTNFIITAVNDAIVATWDAPTDAYVLNGGHIELEYQVVESPEGLWFSLGQMDPTVTTATISGLTIGASYNVQIRSVNAAGIPSAWVVGTAPGGGSPGPIELLGPQLTLTVPDFAWIASDTVQIKIFAAQPDEIVLGAHLYAEIPSQDGPTTIAIGTWTLGDGSSVQGDWAPVDEGRQPWVSPTAPMVFTINLLTLLAASGGVAGNVDVRIYAAAYGVKFDAPLIRAGLANATPNVVLTVTPYPLTKPASGSGETPIQVVSVDATGSFDTPAMTNVSVGGQLITPIQVTVELADNLPTTWAYQAMAFVDGDLTTTPVAVSPASQQSGMVPGNGLITIQAGRKGATGKPPLNDTTPYTFAVPTPVQEQFWTVYIVAGVFRGNAGGPGHGLAGGVGGVTTGIFVPNLIVPGITPSVVIQVGTATGVLDVSAYEHGTQLPGPGVQLGPGVTTDGDDNVVVQAGSGTSLNGDGDLVINTGGAISVDGSNNVVVATGSGITQVGDKVVISLAATPGMKLNGAEELLLQTAAGVTVDGSGNLVVTPGPSVTFSGNNVVVQAGTASGVNIDGSGNVVVKAGTSNGVAFDGSGNVIVKTGLGGLKTDISGNVVVQINGLGGLAVDGSGNTHVVTGAGLGIDGSGNVYVPGGALTPAQMNAAFLAGTLSINAGILGVAPTSIGTPQLTTSELDIGGGGSKPIRLRIFDHSGSALAWIGDDTANSGFDGAWFKTVRIGGSGPSGAPFIADSSGNVTISATLIVGTVNTAAFATSAGSASTAGSATNALFAPVSGLTPGTMTVSGSAPAITVGNGSDHTVLNALGLSGTSGSTQTFFLDCNGAGSLSLTDGSSTVFIGSTGLTLGMRVTSGGSSAALVATGVLVNGTQVVSTQVASVPVTLADVIAVIRHHGLSA